MRWWLELQTLWSYIRARPSVWKEQSKTIKVIGIPASIMQRKSSCHQTVLYALRKSSSVRTECCIGRSWDPFSIVWKISSIWSSHLLPLWKPAWSDWRACYVQRYSRVGRQWYVPKAPRSMKLSWLVKRSNDTRWFPFFLGF